MAAHVHHFERKSIGRSVGEVLRGLYSRLVTPLVDVGTVSSHSSARHEPRFAGENGNIILIARCKYGLERCEHGIVRIGEEGVDVAREQRSGDQLGIGRGVHRQRLQTYAEIVGKLLDAVQGIDRLRFGLVVDHTHH